MFDITILSWSTRWRLIRQSYSNTSAKARDIKPKWWKLSRNEIVKSSELWKLFGLKVWKILISNGITTIDLLQKSTRNALLDLVDQKTIVDMQFEISKILAKKLGWVVYFKFLD